MEGVRAEAVAGLGIAWTPDFLVAESLHSGELVTVMEAESVDGAFWLLWRAGRHRTPRLRTFLDFAAARLFNSPAVSGRLGIEDMQDPSLL